MPILVTISTASFQYAACASPIPLKNNGSFQLLAVFLACLNEFFIKIDHAYFLKKIKLFTLAFSALVSHFCGKIIIHPFHFALGRTGRQSYVMYVCMYQYVPAEATF